ncbi:MAG: T9SS type A sorting domain-containing protein [Candidatus Kapabacteria bacterium]|nr:T9SS type A sorting domain-containing protein [Candidatus Kapabacteria bacterium]
MSWDVSNRILVYDALNYKYDWANNEEVYVDMNALDASTGVIYRILPTLGSGISAGSPDFGKTSKNTLVFLVYDANSNYYYINGLDLYSGTIKNIVYANGAQIGISSPVYSPKDNKLAFQVATPQPAYGIMQIALAADKISPAGNPTDYLTNVGLPKWFAIGKRPVNVEEESINDVITIKPNPATDFIEISLPESFLRNQDINFKIYNSKGECVVSSERNSLETLQRIGISHLPNGMYYLKVGNFSEKFVIIR